MLRVLAVGVVLLLSGCATDPSAPVAPDPAPQDEQQLRLEPPVLEEGHRWTYRMSGQWDLVEEATVVVAEAGPDGYLFAAGAPEDLVDEVAWDGFLFGRKGLDLAVADGGHAWEQPLRFPLFDGATWPAFGMNLTAHAATVDVAGTPAQGFEIRGDGQAVDLAAAYAPDAGYLTRFSLTHQGEASPAFAFDLVSMGRAANWTWYERAHEVVAGAAVTDPTAIDPGDPVGTAPVHSPVDLQVAAGDDVVLFWGVATPGDTGVATAPDGSTWTFEGEGVPHATAVMRPAQAGTWRLTGDAHDGGWVYIQGHALRWLTGDVTGR